MDKLEYPKAFIESLIKYLMRHPYQEVSQFIAGLVGNVEAQEEKKDKKTNEDNK